MKSGNVEGIVISKVNYSDTGLIIRLLTQHEGVMSFIFPGGRSKKKNGNLIQPLSILEVTYQTKPNTDLSSVRELHAAVVWRDIPFNPYKSGILFFMNEVLAQTVRENEDNEGLYLFVKNALQILDLQDDTRHFPSFFLFGLLQYLGFYPKLCEHPKYLDLREGCFVQSTPAHPYFAAEDISEGILQLMNAKLDGTNAPQIPLAMRRKIMYELLNYYRAHFDQFSELQSLPVLEATFHE